tara:strand:- start:333 stop:542 length:210 start_codon:yes stop_codon:yes gene_type:complete
MTSTPSAASPLQPTVVLIGGSALLFLAVLAGTPGRKMPVLLGLGVQVAIGAFLSTTVHHGMQTCARDPA